MSTPGTEDDYSTRGLIVDLTATFAGVLLIISSLFEILQGLSAISNDELYSADTEYLYQFNMDVWGTIHLILGLVGLVAGVAILRRVTWGQVVGIIVAGVSILTNFAFLPHYPWWSMTIIVFDLLLIWALSVQVRRR